MAPTDPAASAFRHWFRVLFLASLFAAATSCVDGSGAPGADTGGDAANVGAAPVSDAAKSAPAAVALNSDPKQLFGMGHAGLADLLGAPVFQRQDAPAELWQYRHKSCVLDLYLYSDSGGSGGGSKVQHYDARSPTGSKFSARECLAALLKSRSPGKS